jgi:ketosteroid isomerase-like protein
VRSRISLQTDLSTKPEPQGDVSEAKFLLLIWHALYRYCRGIDRCDEAALRSTYCEDATDCHGSWNGSVTGFIEQALATLRQGGRRVHQITNVLIELRGDVAAVESSFFALQVTGAQPDRETFLCGRYTNRLERREGEWRVARGFTNRGL